MRLLVTFTICVLLLGTVFVGPLSIRVYSTLIAILYLAFSWRKLKTRRQYPVDKTYLKCFLIFSLFMAFSLLANGEFLEYNFPKRFLAYYLVSIVSFLLYDVIISSKRQLVIIIFSLSLLMNFDAVVTYLQYIGNPIGWGLGSLFGDLSSNLNYIDTHDGLLDVSMTPGVFGHVVANSFFLGSITPLYFYMVKNCNGRFLKIYAIMSVIISILAIFITQQRASFGLLLIALLVINLNYLKSNKVLLAITIIVSLFMFVSIDFSSLGNIDMGRLTSKDNDDRSFLWSKAIQFIGENPIFGGPMRFQRLAGLSSHNIVLDSWVFAGLGGFVVMMLLYIKTLVASLKSVLMGLKANCDIIYTAMAVLVAMLYGLFHNTSYLTGDVIIFILLAIYLKSVEILKAE